MDLDKRAVQVLINAYWTQAGWRRSPVISPEDFAYAKAKGLMFDNFRLSHDASVDRAIAARDAISREQVVSCFVVSLRTRRLDLRSGLGSYAATRHLTRHKWVSQSNSSTCSICGEPQDADVDLNVLNFERIKWGGVRHTQPCYVGFDLQQLAHAPRPHPGRADYLRLNAVLDIARSMPSAARLADLAKALGAILPSNDQERRALIAILGYCGVLVDPAKPDFRESFVPTYLREYAANDWPFPVNWWSAARGVTEEAVDDWFPPTTWH